MKFRLNATIAIYFLFTILFSCLSTYASQEKKENSQWEKFSIFVQDFTHAFCGCGGGFVTVTQPCDKKKNTQKIVQPNSFYLSNEKKNAQSTIISELLSSPQSQHTVHLFPNSLLLKSKNNILFLIVNQFLTCKDILILQKTCKFFQHLLQPNHANMLAFCNYSDSKTMADTTIIWNDLKYFLKQSYYSAFEDMKMFNMKENQYAVLTRGLKNKIIIWNNYLAPYPQMLLDQATQNTPFGNQQDSYSILPMKIFNKLENAFARITKEGNVKTGGNRDDGGDSRIVQSQLQKVKTIVATLRAFAALLVDGRVYAWGNEDDGGKIPDEIQIKLQNVKMIFSTDRAFAALLNNGHVKCWGHKYTGGKKKTGLQHVKMIYSNKNAFVALLDDGSIIAWGMEDYGGKISSEIQMKLHQNVKTIFSTDIAFAALLNDGSVVAWGHWRGAIPVNIQAQLHQNVKMIFSNHFALAALLNDGSVVAWGHEKSGGEIPEHIQIQLYQNVKMIFSTRHAFSALLNDDSVVSWGYKYSGGEIPDNIQTRLYQNTKVIVSTDFIFFALLNDGSVVGWGYSIDVNGATISYEMQFFELKNITMIFSTRDSIAGLFDNGCVFTWGIRDYDQYRMSVLQNVITIIPTARQFIAICKDGEGYQRKIITQ